ncbi:MAG: prolipoprotein diacylglyceryl transferase [Anaerolineae bacterium]|nr:prolipoprotein diacylglyceryl transferase [Anaerolineae bacterium]
MTPPFDMIMLKLGPFAVYWYGFLIVVGIMLGATSAAFLAKRAGHNPDYIWDMLLTVVITAVIGARIYHVFSRPEGGLIGWDYYKQHPIEALYVWQGGLGIWGAVIGGAIGVLLYTRRRDLRTLQWLDFAVPGMALGQSIGRWGNYMNRELYGPPTTLLWGLIIPPEFRILPYTDLSQYPTDTLFHPTFLYESLAALALFLILFLVAVKRYERLKEGDLLMGYLIGYAIIRFFTEMLRPDAWTLGTLAAAQVFSLLFIVLGVAFLIVRHRPKKQEVTAPETTIE